MHSDFPAGGIRVLIHPRGMGPVALEGSEIARSRPQRSAFWLQLVAVLALAGGLAANIISVVGPAKHVSSKDVLVDGLFILFLLLVVVLVLVWLARHLTKNRRARYSVTDSDWMSRLGFFLGPYNDAAGLDGSKDFLDLHSRNGRQPQGYLIATQQHLAIASADRPFQTMVCPYSAIETIELYPGTKNRKVLLTSGSAHLLGQVVVTTKEGRLAGFSGIPVDAVAACLSALGASVIDG